MTKQPVSTALARSSRCQWARPVGNVKAAGTARMEATNWASARQRWAKRTSQQTVMPSPHGPSGTSTGGTTEEAHGTADEQRDGKEIVRPYRTRLRLAQ